MPRMGPKSAKIGSNWPKWARKWPKFILLSKMCLFEKIGVFDIFGVNTLIEFIKRHYRNYGIRRRQLQEEISSLFDLPMKNWGSGPKDSRARIPRQIPPRMDPTHSADSVFLLNIYNDLNEEGEFDLVRYSKPALDVRKRKSQIHRFVSTYK